MFTLDGGWEQHLFLAEGRSEGTMSGPFRGANFPRRHGAAGPFRSDFRAAIEPDDSATSRTRSGPGCAGSSGVRTSPLQTHTAGRDVPCTIRAST